MQNRFAAIKRHGRAATAMNGEIMPPRQREPFPSSLFVEQKLRIRTVRPVGADQDEIHVCEHAEAAVCAGLQLIAQIGRAVVQEFRAHAAGKGIGQVDITSDKGVERLHPGHARDLQGVDFVDELTLEPVKPAGVADRRVL